MDNERLNELEQKAIDEIQKAKDQYEEIVGGYGFAEAEQGGFNFEGYPEYKVEVGIYSHGGDEWIPKYATSGASGLDLRAYITEPVTLQPLERKLIPTGIYVNIPKDYEIQIRPRSGMAFKRGLTLINCTGTIDDDYIKEIFVPLVNLDSKPQTIEPKERIAQMVLSKVDKLQWVLADSPDEFEARDRTGGFGSTGNI
jgi:dUTP pyrophosphatase